jgi:hypothetical protein
MEITDKNWGGMDRILLAQGRMHWRAILITVVKLRIPLYAGKFLSGYTTGGFSKRVQLYVIT